jgi:ABC-type dipeptide/oligopeptide/nickel transport system permease component
MLRYLVARALGAMVSIVGVTAIVFVVLRLTGNPAALLIDPGATPAQVEELRRSLGLDASIPEQYLRFVGGILRGDFGTSFRYHQPALPAVLDRVPATATLALATLALTLAVSIPLGMLAAVRRDSAFDRAVSLVTLLGQATPTFWLGIVLILVVAVNLRLLPTSGNATPAHLLLPMLTLAAAPISKYTRLTRAEMLEVLSSDYIRTARAKGLSELEVRYRHALKNASIALVTLIGLDVGYLLGGSVIVETVFAWPGIGRLMIDAVSQQDFPVVQADVFLLASLVVFANFAVDAVYPLLDPRIRLAA